MRGTATVALAAAILWIAPRANAQGKDINAESMVAAARALALQPGQSSASAATRAADALLQRAKATRAATDTLATLLKEPTTTADALRAGVKTAREAADGLPALVDSAVAQATAAAGSTTSDASRAMANGYVVEALVRAKAVQDAVAIAGRTATAAGQGPEGGVREQADSVHAAVLHASTAAEALAGLVAGTAVEASAPRLAVLGGSDNDVLEALRVRITGGSIFSNGQARVVKAADGSTATVQSSQFAQAAVYLALESQPRVFNWSCGPSARAKQGCRGRASERGYERFYIEPSLALRLTTIPVTGAVAGNGNGDAIQSQKAAQVGFGALSSFNFGGFGINDTRFHWAVGPVGRAFFQSVTDAQRATRVWNLDDDLYGSWSVGARLALYEKDRHVGEQLYHGWAPAAHIDVSYGFFQNFETATGGTPAAEACLALPAKCLATGVPPSTDFTTKDSGRWYVEGRVNLQYLYLGFDMNNGDGSDDLRFIGGVSMKLDQFFTRR